MPKVIMSYTFNFRPSGQQAKDRDGTCRLGYMLFNITLKRALQTDFPSSSDDFVVSQSLCDLDPTHPVYEDDNRFMDLESPIPNSFDITHEKFGSTPTQVRGG